MTSGLSRLWYSIMYLFSPPWDTGIPAPELVRTVASLPAGRAMDIGCGTGTNLLFLAQRGWEVTGVDFVHRAIAVARKKLKTFPATLRVVDVTKLESADLPGPYDLALDMGCFHSLARADRARYERGLAHWVKPGGLFLLYAFQPAGPGDSRGVSRGDVLQYFAADFRCSEYEQGTGRPSAWYFFVRKEKSAGPDPRMDS
jgi:SAM-dependent methyltransferase